MKLDLNYKQLSPYLITFSIMVASVVVGNYIFCKMVVKKDVISPESTEKQV